MFSSKTALFFIQAASGAGQGYLSSQCWEKAVAYQMAALAGLRHHYQPYSGYLGQALLQVVQARHRLGRGGEEDSRQLLEEAGRLLRVVPGTKHYLYTQYFLPLYKSLNSQENNKS